MKMINIQQAKTHLSRIVEAVGAGEDIVLAKAGKPLVRLIPFQETKQTRELGLLAGQVVETADCWETDEELEALFYGETDEENDRRIAEERA